jgi:2Fe-2S ferredoxin
MKMKLISSGKEELKVTEIEIEPEKSVLEMCHKNGIEIRSICKGLPSCAECRVKIAEGEHNVIPPNKAELSLIGSSYYLDQRRLACQLKCFGPVTIDITEQMETRNDSTKKVRGFRLHTPPGGKPVEQVSRAVQDTLV